MRGRRRRRRWYWLPTLGREGPSGGQFDDVYWDEFAAVNIPANASSAVQVQDFAPDFPKDSGTGTPTDNMSDFLTSAYMLRRIVGNVYVHPVSTSLGSQPNIVRAWLITYAIFVGRAEEANQNLTPIGSATNFDVRANYGPQFVDNVREPYIFHRNWLIGQAANITTAAGDASPRFPPTNAGYGSNFEGTFVDQRTLRRIDGDNRLFHIVQARNYPLNASNDGVSTFTVTCALRILGRPIRPAKSGAM